MLPWLDLRCIPRPCTQGVVQYVGSHPDPEVQYRKGGRLALLGKESFGLAGLVRDNLTEIHSFFISHYNQKTYRIPICTSRGSPRPDWTVPSKLKSRPALEGSRKLSVLSRLKISTMASKWPLPNGWGGIGACPRRKMHCLYGGCCAG